MNDAKKTKQQLVQELEALRTRVVELEHEETDREKAQNLLQESEEKYRSLISNIPNVTWTTDREGNTTFISPNIETVYGFTPEEIYQEGGRLWLGRIHPDDIERVKEGYGLLFSENKMFDVEYRIQRKDGRWIWAHDKAISTYEKDGVMYADGLFSDITERKRAEEALAEERNLLCALMDNIPDHIYFKDTESRFVRVNKATSDSFGLSKPAQVVGKTDSDFFTKEHAQEAYADEQEVMRCGQPLVGKEEKETWPDGQETWKSTTKLPLHNQEGYIIGTCGISRDITERKRAEEQLEAANEELEAFAHSIAHDLRAPLRAIEGFAGALTEDYSLQLDETARSYLAEISDGAVRMEQLINDLLLHARLGQGILEFGPVDMVEVVNRAKEHLRTTVGESRATIRVEGSLPTVKGHRGTLVLLIQNLLDNAMKFISRGNLPEVVISSTEDETSHTISVRDSGIGIEDRFHDSIFKIFERLHTRDAFPGTGIGLAIVKKAATIHGGEVWVKSKPGVGSTFHVRVPKQLEKRGKES